MKGEGIQKTRKFKKNFQITIFVKNYTFHKFFSAFQKNLGFLTFQQLTKRWIFTLIGIFHPLLTAITSTEDLSFQFLEA